MPAHDPGATPVTPPNDDPGAQAPVPGDGLPPKPPLGAPRGACTEMGCQNGLSMSLEPGAQWPAGDYRIEIDADGASQVCTVTLPLKACGAGPSVTCSGAALATIGESGCALPAREHGLSSLHFDGTPRQGKVTISRGGAPLITQDLAPTYRWVQPNGSGCGPQCLQGSATLRVPL